MVLLKKKKRSKYLNISLTDSNSEILKKYAEILIGIKDQIKKINNGKKMLEYDRIDISEGIDINKANASKECDICHYWYFLDKNFNYEP